MDDEDIFEEKLSKFLIENNFSDIKRNNYQNLDSQTLNILLKVNYNNYKIKKFLMDYIEDKIDFNLFSRGDETNLLNGENLKLLFERSNIQQLMTFISNKLHELYMLEKFPIQNFDKLLSFYPDVQNMEIKNDKIIFDLPEKYFFIKYNSELKKDEKEIQKLWVCKKDNITELLDKLTLKKIFVNGYFYIYENIIPLKNCIYYPDNYIGNIFANYNILNLRYFENDEKYFQDYVFEKITDSGVFSENQVWMSFKHFKQNLKLKNIIEISNFEKLFRKSKDKYLIFENALDSEKYDAIEIILKYLPVTNSLIEHALFDEELGNLIEDKGLLKFPYTHGSEKVNCEIIKLNCSNEKDYEIIEKFRELEDEQKKYFTFIYPLTTGRCDENDFYLIAYKSIDDRIMLCGSLNYRIIGNMYYIDYLGTQTLKNDIVKGIGSCLMKTLENDVILHSVKRIVLYSLPEARDFYFKMGFESNPAGLMIKEID